MRQRLPGKPRRGSFFGDRQAAASGTIAFLVAGVLFMGSVATVLVTTRTTGGPELADAPQASILRLQARDIAALLVDSPGYSASGTWSSDADLYTGRSANADLLLRLGLLDDADQSMLGYAKLQNLRRAPLAADATDGYVNYEEARRSLGLDGAGRDFHVRAYPQLAALDDLMASEGRDGNLRVTYIGHYEVTYNTIHGVPLTSTQGLGVGTPQCVISNDVSGGSANTPPQGNPAGAPQNYRLQATVTNGGSTPTQFTALFKYTLGTGASAYEGTRRAQSYLVDPDDSTVMFVDIPARPGVSCAAGSRITVEVSEPLGNMVSQSTTLATGVTTATVGSRDLHLEATKSVFTTPSCSAAIELDWSSPARDVGANDFLGMKVVKGTGEQVWPETGYYTFKGNSGNKAKVDGVCLEPGEYRGYLYFSGSNTFTDTSQHVVTHILVQATAPTGFVAKGTAEPDLENPIYTSRPPVQVEAKMLEALVDRFCPAYYSHKERSPLAATSSAWTEWDSRCSSFAGGRAVDTQGRCKSFGRNLAGVEASQPGDVIPDIKCDMDEALPARLTCQLALPEGGDSARVGCPGAGLQGAFVPQGEPRYDITNVLIVGSEVNHAAMTSGAAKFAVRDWVLGGGTLIAFGSEAGNVNWLQPLFHAAIRSSSGGISTPDIAHPILHVPNELDDPANTYDAHGQTWNFNGQTAQAQDDEASALFTNVIVAGGDALQGDPLLAHSRPGALGSGSVILTAYLPYDLYGSERSALPGGAKCPDLTLGECEGMRFIHNLMMSAYGDLYLDYGPPCPAWTNCVPSVRSALVQHPDFAVPIELKLNVYVF